MPKKSELSGILRRGSACLSCRRRKLRCDGVRPVCNQCTAMKRPHECKFDDSSRKSRTQSLREKVFTLEAKVRELEYQPGSSKHPTAISLDETSPSSLFASYADSLTDFQADFQESAIWDASNMDPSMLSALSSSLPFDHGFDPPLHFSSNSSPSHSDSSLSTPLNLPIPLYGHTNLVEGGAHDSSSDRSWSEGPANLSLSPEIHKALIDTFITHHKQYCFYTDTTRLDTCSSGTGYDRSPPSPSLMSSVYLLGSFFARTSALPEGLEQLFLDKTLHDVSRSLHNQEQLMDVVQALSLLAQYFFFNNRDMEGNRHLMAAKRMAIELGLHKIQHPDLSLFPFDLDYPFAESTNGILAPSTVDPKWSEQAAVFWQVFMVENLWSASICVTALPDFESPCRKVTTPLPLIEVPEMEATTRNSSIHSLFYAEPDDFHASCLSITSLKIMASSIFNRSLRAHNAIKKDGATWAYYRSAELALSRLLGLVPEFTGKDGLYRKKPYFDTDLYMVHSLALASTIHLHVDGIMNLKISLAAKKLVELVSYLDDDDYIYLDPAIAVCWTSIIRAFLRMIEGSTQSQTNGLIGSNATYSVMFLRRCVDSLQFALRGMARHICLADHLLSSVENVHALHYPTVRKPFQPTFGEVLEIGLT